MTRTVSKRHETSPTGVTDPVEALVAAHVDAARDHLAQELTERADIERDIAFAFMVTNGGPAR